MYQYILINNSACAHRVANKYTVIYSTYPPDYQ